MFTNQLISKYFNTYENIVVAFLKCVVTRQVDFKNKILHNQKKFFDLFYQINIACNYSMQSTKNTEYQALSHKLLDDLSYD